MKTKITVFISVLVLCAIMLMGENLDYQSYTHGTMDITTLGDVTCSTLTVNGALAVSGGVDVDGTFEGDTLDANMHLNVDGTSQFDGRADFDGSVDIGNSATNDTVFFTSRIGSDIDPTATDTYAFGSNSLRWDYWGGDLNISDSTVLGGTVDVTGATALNGAVTFGSTIGAGADAFPDTTIDYAEECSIFVDGSFVNDDELASNDTTNWGIAADSVTAIVPATVWDSLLAEKILITDATGTDSLWFYNDGDTAWITSDNPFQFKAFNELVWYTDASGITGAQALFAPEIHATATFGVGFVGDLTGTADTANYCFTVDTTGVDLLAYLTGNYLGISAQAADVDTAGTDIAAALADRQDAADLLTQLVSCTDSATCATDTLFLWKGGKVAEIVFATP